MKTIWIIMKVTYEVIAAIACVLLLVGMAHVWNFKALRRQEAKKLGKEIHHV